MKVPPESSGGVIEPSRTLRRQRSRLGRDLGEALEVGVEDGRYDQRVASGDGDPDVDALIELPLAVAIGTVRARELAQRDRARLDDHVVERRDHGALGRGGLDPSSRSPGGAHVDVRLQIEVRRGRLRLGHAAADGLLQFAELDDLDSALRCLRRRRNDGRRRGSRGGARGRRVLHVGLDDAPAGPGALEGVEVYPALLGDPPRERTRLHPPVGASRGCARSLALLGGRGSRDLSRSLGGGRGRRRRTFGGGGGRLRSNIRSGARTFGWGLPVVAAVTTRWSFRRIAHPRDHLADRQRVTLAGDDLDQGSRSVGLEHHVRLIGLDLDQLFAERDLVADRLHPGEHGPLFHRVGQPRHDDIYGHGHLRPLRVRGCHGQPNAPCVVARAALTTCSA